MLRSVPELRSELRSVSEHRSELRSDPELRSELRSVSESRSELRSVPELRSELRSVPELQSELRSVPESQVMLRSVPGQKVILGQIQNQILVLYLSATLLDETPPRDTDRIRLLQQVIDAIRHNPDTDRRNLINASCGAPLLRDRLRLRVRCVACGEPSTPCAGSRPDGHRGYRRSVP